MADGSAVLSDDGLYRYQLRRSWGTEKEPSVCWIMLNPSTADADLDDPTIRRCTAFSNRWGFGHLIVANLFALRATSPKALLAAPDPIGSANDAHILAAAGESDQVIVAWGTHGTLHNRAAKVTQLLTGAGNHRLLCLERTKDGHPKHPLYVRGERRPEVYREPLAEREHFPETA